MEANDPETDDALDIPIPMGRLSKVEDPDGNLTYSYRYNGLRLKIKERVRIRKEKDEVCNKKC